MNTMDNNMCLADYYLTRLNTLSDKAKVYVMKKLADSLIDNKESTERTKEEKNVILRRLADVWKNDPESEMMSEAILKGRESNKTRKLSMVPHAVLGKRDI